MHAAKTKRRHKCKAASRRELNERRREQFTRPASTCRKNINSRAILRNRQEKGGNWRTKGRFVTPSLPSAKFPASPGNLPCRKPPRKTMKPSYFSKKNQNFQCQTKQHIKTKSLYLHQNPKSKYSYIITSHSLSWVTVEVYRLMFQSILCNYHEQTTLP